jgi:hypothetical protein
MLCAYPESKPALRIASLNNPVLGHRSIQFGADFDAVALERPLGQIDGEIHGLPAQGRESIGPSRVITTMSVVIGSM